MGELPGNHPNSPDEKLLPFISSANIACGLHAGDSRRMRLTVDAAARQGVAIGAHPGFDDKDNFGRTELPVTYQDVYELMLYQIGALYGFAQAAGEKLSHVKPHGALYNMAASDPELATAIVDAVFDFDPRLILYALSGSEMVLAARKKGLPVAQEGFIDRRYADSGRLLSRLQANALISDEKEAAQQALRLIRKQEVISADGKAIPCAVDTLCIHGDGVHAQALAEWLHQALTHESILILSPGQR